MLVKVLCFINIAVLCMKIERTVKDSILNNIKQIKSRKITTRQAYNELRSMALIHVVIIFAKAVKKSRMTTTPR